MANNHKSLINSLHINTLTDVFFPKDSFTQMLDPQKWLIFKWSDSSHLIESLCCSYICIHVSAADLIAVLANGKQLIIDVVKFLSFFILSHIPTENKRVSQCHANLWVDLHLLLCHENLCFFAILLFQQTETCFLVFPFAVSAKHILGYFVSALWMMGNDRGRKK